MNKVLFSALLVLPLLATAAPIKKAAPAPAPELSLREQALYESKSANLPTKKNSKHASDAQQAEVASFLRLQDPTPELINRPWLWTFALKFQAIEPVGTGKVNDMGFDLKNYGQSVMPSIELGFLINATEGKYIGWDSGLAAQGGYTTKTTTLVTPNGYQYKDTRLNTTIAAVIWNNRLEFLNAPKWSVLVAPQTGVLNYTQSSASSSLANFNESLRYYGLGLGLDYAVSNKWGVLAQYTYRDANAKNTTVGMQQDNFEIGTTVTW